jgi:lysophospholipase L1-like esterase
LPTFSQSLVNKHLAAILTPPLLPLLLAQGYLTRKRTPRLPDAAGPLAGAVIAKGEPLRLIALGESTVAGVGAATHETGLAGQLATALALRLQQSVSWLVIARSGINARQSLVELVPKLVGQRADVVMIGLGVNDSIEFHTARRWATDITRLVAAICAQVGEAPVLLAGVPPLGVFPALPQPLSFVLGARSASLDAASVIVARNLPQVVHVPFQMETSEARRLFCADGFHPSELGYRLWAEQLAAAYVSWRA